VIGRWACYPNPFFCHQGGGEGTQPKTKSRWLGGAGSGARVAGREKKKRAEEDEVRRPEKRQAPREKGGKKNGKLLTSHR